MDVNNYLPQVRYQYEDFPYPERNPADEKIRLNGVTIDCLDRINYFCHGGMKDFTKGARILVAGGGTGDSVIFFAEQLRNSDSEIVYLDFSKSSMEIAKERASIRGLTNISWVSDSILNIPNLDFGKFDHISCTGVLHHLEDPDEGLRILNSVLNEEGAMSLMLYAKYGRTAIYQIQSLMRIINKNQQDIQSCIDNCRSALEVLPQDHWFNLAKHNKNISDIELYDLYLHSQDRCYDVLELYELVENADLEVVHLFDDYGIKGNALYEPEEYTNASKMLKIISNMDKKQQQAVAEIINGRIKLHSFYVSKRKVKKPNYTMLDFVPSLPLTVLSGSYSALYSLVDSVDGDISINISSNNSDNIILRFRKSENINKFFRNLDGQHTLGEIYRNILPECDGAYADYGNLIEGFTELYHVMEEHNLLLLRHQSLSKYKTLDELHAQMNK